MKEFIASYYQQVSAAAERLALPGDERQVDILTREILNDLWERKEQLDAAQQKGVFIYKVVLTHVFSYLKARGETGKIEYLQKILPIHPVHYLSPEVSKENSI